jgi:chromosome segregation ATPase
MPKLKNSVISEVLNNLNCSGFTQEDFTVDVSDASSAFAKIYFSSMPKYQFEIEEHVEGRNYSIGVILQKQESELTKVIRTIETPGDYLNTEYHTVNSISGAINRIPTWVQNIQEDLIHSKNIQKTKVDDTIAELHSSIDDSIENQEDYFQETEKESLIAKLNELQARVESLEEKMDIDPKQIKHIESAIEKTKNDVDLYPKGVWYKTSATKLFKLIKDVLKTSEGREIATDVIKKLMTLN